MAGCRTMGLAAFVLMVAASGAQAESLLAVPDGGRPTLWDTSAHHAIARFTGVNGGTAGGRYVVNGRTITPDSDPTACLGHLRTRSELVTGGADPHDIVGAVSPLEGPLSDYSQGFAITDLCGIDYCGESESCDKIFVPSVPGDAALTSPA